MIIELSEQEREFLAALLEQKASELIHEKNRAAHQEYKETLRREIEMAEALLARVMVPAQV